MVNLNCFIVLIVLIILLMLILGFLNIIVNVFDSFFYFG